MSLHHPPLQVQIFFRTSLVMISCHLHHNQVQYRQKNGTDVLLDLLSTGSPPTQNGSFSADILSIGEDNNKTTVNALNGLSSPVVTSAQSSHTSPVMNLLDGLGPNPTMPKDNGPTYLPLVAFESSSLSLIFKFSKQLGSPQITQIEASFTNKSSEFLQLHLEPASSNTLPGNGNGSITQKLRVTNNQHGKKSLVMRIRISYKLNNKDMLDEGQISNFQHDL